MGRVIEAGTLLVRAHIELGKVEASQIGAQLAKIVGGAFVAAGCLVLALLVLFIAGLLFFDEAVFGSIGWTVLHGPLFLIAIAVTIVLAVIGFGGVRILIDIVVAVLIGIAVGIVFALGLTNAGWAALGDAILPQVEAGVRPLVTAVAVLAAVFGLLGLLGGARAGGIGGAVGGLFAGALFGVVIGAFTALDPGTQVGAAIGLTAGLAAWTIVLGLHVARRGIDAEALQARLTPSRSIEMAKETTEWLKKRLPLNRQ